MRCQGHLDPTETVGVLGVLDLPKKYEGGVRDHRAESSTTDVKGREVMVAKIAKFLVATRGAVRPCSDGI